MLSYEIVNSICDNKSDFVTFNCILYFRVYNIQNLAQQRVYDDILSDKTIFFETAVSKSGGQGDDQQ